MGSDTRGRGRGALLDPFPHRRFNVSPESQNYLLRTYLKGSRTILSGPAGTLSRWHVLIADAHPHFAAEGVEPTRLCLQNTIYEWTIFMCFFVGPSLSFQNQRTVCVYVCVCKLHSIHAYLLPLNSRLARPRFIVSEV